eukprot:1154560-Pelagomonas_calceolata.AAC.20
MFEMHICLMAALVRTPGKCHFWGDHAQAQTAIGWIEHRDWGPDLNAHKKQSFIKRLYPESSSRPRKVWADTISMVTPLCSMQEFAQMQDRRCGPREA